MEVIHEKSKQRFCLGDSHLEYEVEDGGTCLNIYHTYTAPAKRGQGIAGKVTAAAFEYAKANDMRVKGTCSYVLTFVEKRPEWAEMLQ